MRFHSLHHCVLCILAFVAVTCEARAGSYADFPDAPGPTPAPIETRVSPPVQPLPPPPTRPAAAQPAPQASGTWFRPAAAPAAAATPAGDRSEATRDNARRRQAWMLSLDAVTHAPIDMGAQLGLETPQGLRLSGGYGWVPQAYMGLLTGLAASASGNTYAQALLDQARYSGHTWRIQAGLRPFHAVGFYLDAGYARLSADGELDLSSTGVPMLAALGGGYRASTRLDMWLVELGYQAELGDRVVLGLALGCMGTFSAKTSISSVGGAPSSSLLGSAAAQTDTALEKYGYAPTFTARLGFDLI